ncbi:MAG: cupin domain-containing protein [Chloroflexota bacterium]
MTQEDGGQSYAKEQKYDIGQFVEFLADDRVKKDVFKGEHFNVVIICLDDGYEIIPHHEPYDVFFHVVSGRGILTAGEKEWAAGPGSMVFAPAGIRGIRCLERMTILGIQEPH